MDRTDSFIQEQVGLQAFDAIQLNHFKRIHFFLKKGLNANMRDSKKRTLLMCSCNLANQQTALKFVNLLLSYKARIALSDTNGLNALHHAVLWGHERIVARFLEFAGNYDINNQDNDGNTALMLAVFTENIAILEQIVKALRKYDLSVDIANNKGVTPLIQATILGENEMAKCLVAVGKASEQIRDMHFRKSASEWERMGEKKRIQSSHCYATMSRTIHTSPPQVLFLGDSSRCNVERPIGERNSSSSMWIAGFDNSEKESYNWPDLNRVYGLYEQQLSSSYRRSAPPRRKTPPPSSDSSSDGTSLWRTATTRLKQRRHTVALSRSLPKAFFSRRSMPTGRVGCRSFSIESTDQEDIGGSKWPSLRQSFTKRNSVRGQSDRFGLAPSTAPGELESSLLRNRSEIKRRSSLSLEKTQWLSRRGSVTFQTTDLKNSEAEANVLQFPMARPSSTKYRERNFRKTDETSLPIFEHEEDSARNDYERK